MYFFFFKQKTAYEMRISDWSSDVCSSDLSIVGHKEWVCLRADRSERRQMMEHENAKRDTDRRRLSVVNIVLAGFLVIDGFFLILQPRAHLLGWLPFLLHPLCPFIPNFMHGGHGVTPESPKAGLGTA